MLEECVNRLRCQHSTNTNLEPLLGHMGNSGSGSLLRSRQRHGRNFRHQKSRERVSISRGTLLTGLDVPLFTPLPRKQAFTAVLLKQGFHPQEPSNNKETLDRFKAYTIIIVHILFFPHALQELLVFLQNLLQNSFACFCARDARPPPIESSANKRIACKRCPLPFMHAEGFRLLSTDTLTRGIAVVLLCGKKHGAVRRPHAV